jgi:acyl CoA:acetate/3-ketoacid CoA transferase beta subunit
MIPGKMVGMGGAMDLVAGVKWWFVDGYVAKKKDLAPPTPRKSCRSALPLTGVGVVSHSSQPRRARCDA